jgi:ATP-dependent exoDNAse (exonuclease V) beta subunit
MASAVNKYEIYYIKRIIDELYHCKNRREALPVVGIITPYRGQAAELKKTYRGSDTRVHTIHSVQGKEMDVVIISMVDDTPTREIFKERNLFNVALSRARHKLIILCNENFITTSTPSFYTAIHDYCERRGSAYAISSKAQPVHTTAGKKLEKLSRLESRPTACVEYILKLSNRWASKDIRRHAIDTYFRLVDSSRHQATLEEVDYVTRYYADSSHLERYAPRISAVALSAPKNAVGKILISRYTNPHLVQIISRACGTAAHRGHAVQGEDE